MPRTQRGKTGEGKYRFSYELPKPTSMNHRWRYLPVGIVWLATVVVSWLSFTEQIQLSAFLGSFFHTLAFGAPIMAAVVFIYLSSLPNKERHG